MAVHSGSCVGLDVEAIQRRYQDIIQLANIQTKAIQVMLSFESDVFVVGRAGNGYYASRTQREASSSESDSDNELCAGRTQREVSNWSGDQFQSSRHSDNGGLKMTTADSNAGNIVLGVGAVALASVAAVGLYNWWNSGSKTTDSEKKKNKP